MLKTDIDTQKLENVEYTRLLWQPSWDLIIIWVAFGLYGSYFLHCAYATERLFTDCLTATVVIGTLVIIWCSLVYANRSRFSYQWQIDSLGISRNYGGRIKSIRWEEITKVKISNKKPEKISIFAHHKKIEILNEPGLIIASIWYHLCQHGLVNEKQPPQFIQSLLEPIPKTISSVRDWWNPKLPSILKVIPQTVLLLIGFTIWIVVICAKKDGVDKRAFITLISIIFGGKGFVDYLFLARRIIFFENIFWVETIRGKVEMHWDRITTADLDANSLTLGESWNKIVVIPVIPKDRESMELVLAMVRRLRNLPKPILLPILGPLAEYVLPENAKEAQNSDKTGKVR